MDDNIHSQISFSELWAQSSKRHTPCTHLLSQNNTLNHWSHTNTTLHMLRERLHFDATTDGSSAPLAVWGLISTLKAG